MVTFLFCYHSQQRKKDEFIMKNTGLSIKIDPDLNLQFREKVLRLCGVQRGCIAKCVEDAIENWINIQENPSKRILSKNKHIKIFSDTEKENLEQEETSEGAVLAEAKNKITSEVKESRVGFKNQNQE